MSALGHVDDYPEIPVSLASTRTVLKTGAWRSVRPVMEERLAPCSAACPAGVAIPHYIDHLKAGRLEQAFHTFVDRNPFPRITGRVCPHTCEGACNLTVAIGDDPLSIREVERWMGDATAGLPHPPPAEATGHRVAVVGSGPAGLSAAYYLRRSGHEVTVFERRDRLGGMLRNAIPDYRLPDDVVDGEIRRLVEMGIEFRTGVDLGTDVTLDDLEESHAAVFVATGACRERMAHIHGEHLLTPGLAFLEAVARRDPVPAGGRTAVIGGGNTAMDVARVSRRMGAEVTVLYRRTADEMPAIREEYERAAADGVDFEWLVLPREVTEEGGDLIVTVEEMRLGDPDPSGRPTPEPTGVTRELRFDRVYTAIGELADLEPFPARLRAGNGWLETGPDGSTLDPLLYTGGDLVTGPSTVVEAIAAGRAAARAIDAELGFGNRWHPAEPTDTVAPAEVHPAYLPHRPRPPERPAESPDPFAEETVTLTAGEILSEIERCLSCGHCNACGTCFVFCPDGAIRWEDGPVIDLEFCKGCGICVEECPGHALVLVNEREVSRA